MSRGSLLFGFFSVTLAVMHAQPVINGPSGSPPGLQAAATPTSSSIFGPAITSGTNLSTFTLIINGQFTPANFTNVTWSNPTTATTTTFDSSQIVSNSASQIVVNIPGALFPGGISAAQTVNVTVTETLSAYAQTSNVATFTINPPLFAPNPTVLPVGSVGAAYTYAIFGGGTAPFTVGYLNSSGTLPTGLSFQSGTTLAGTPTQAGLFTFNASITDEWGNQVTPTETIEVVASPTISQIVPAGAPAGSNPVSITVTGTNFVVPTIGLSPNYAGTVLEVFRAGANPISLPTVISGNTATATIPAGFLTTPQTLTIIVVQPDGSTANTGFTVSAPTLTAVSPSPITARATPVTVTVTGTGFLASGFGQPTQSVILINDVPAATTYVNSTTLTASATFPAPNSTISFIVENPGGSTSGLINVNVLPAPTLASVSPAPFPGGALTVTGTNYTNTMVIFFNGQAIPTVFGSATQLSGTVPANRYTAGPVAQVTVVTTDNYVTAPVSVVLSTALHISTTSLPAATGLQPYSAALAATGGTLPCTWSATGLPGGLSVNSSTGAISGTPTGFGSFTVAATVRDANGLTAAAQLVLAVSTPAPAPVLGSGSPPTGYVNVSYNYGFFATGGNGALTFGFGSGTAPPGLTLDPTGVLRGLPTTVGSYTFTLVVTDSDGLTASGAYTVVIKPQPLSILTPGPLTATVGTAVGMTFTAIGGVPPYTFGATGNLPPGTSVGANGAFTGTPTTAGAYSFTVTVNDSAADTPGSKTFAITVNPAALAVAASFGNGQVGTAYSATVGATGGVPPYKFIVTGLPLGLTFANGGVTGTPVNAGQYTVVVTVTDSTTTSVSARYPMTIGIPTLAVTTSSLANGTVGLAYGAGLAASGGTGRYSWSASGLPPGLAVITAPAITGVPTAAGSYTVTVTVTDTGVSASATLTLLVSPAALAITTALLTGGAAGSPYSATLAAKGGVPPYTWSVTGLPTGLSATAAGAIFGTPTAPGSFSLAVTATDSAGSSASSTLTLAIGLPTAPTLTITGLPATSTPATQSSVGIGLSAAYPVAVTVNLTLTFAPDSGADDPTVQFSTGGRTAQITVPAGATAAVTTLGLQTGTVAGTATITAQLVANGQNITPSPAPSRTLRINSVAPAITSVAYATTSTGFTITVIGYATSRAMTQAVFTFTAASGVSLQTTSVTVPLASLFSTWYASSAALPFGGQFSYTQPFTVTGGTSAVASISVILTNGDGSSSPVTVTAH